jgi:hypothetical protein
MTSQQEHVGDDPHIDNSYIAPLHFMAPAKA